MSQVVLGKLCAALGTTGDSSLFTLLCFLHNVALGVYSMVRPLALLYRSLWLLLLLLDQRAQRWTAGLSSLKTTVNSLGACFR